MLAMRITVTVKAGTKTASVEKVGERSYSVRVKAPPIEGRANEAVIRALGEYFDIPKSRIKIVRGHNSRVKVLDLA